MSFNTKNYKEQGGEKTVIGGEMQVESGAKITAAGTQAATIADLTDTASGAEIATAVNAIIAALKGVGIIAEGE